MTQVAFVEPYYESVTGAQQSMLPLLTDTDSFDATLVVPSEGALATEARERGVSVDVVGLPDELDRSGDELLDTHPASLLSTAAGVTGYPRKIVRYLRERDYDAVYCNSLKAVVLFGPAAKLLGIPVVWYVRIDTPISVLDTLAHRLADHVITISDGTKTRFDGPLTRDGKATTIYTGVDLDEFSATSADDRDAPDFPFADRDGPIIAEVATIQPRKGQHHLVDAVGAVADSLGDFELVFAGEASDEAYKHGSDYAESLRRRVADAGIEDRTTFLGWCDDVPSLLAEIDLFVLPSYNEGLPRSIMEAFALGVPVVATPAGGTRELVAHGENGFIVPKGSTDELADALERLGSDSDRRARMGRNARRTVVEQFSQERYVENFETYLAEEVL
ncbi:glycosyltransferase (plasmid) [Halorussus limi]|uniref:Glycosyltransferase n=1 Tax=Halorussus limi TaxID=2938695 RepID=A0A8U0I0F0_9EURY|nr:glycosyltransferase [Halorussus limi]UPV76658.1 glycosyltransferase [Halorussus limi]